MVDQDSIPASVVRIEYDDQPDEVIENVNKALASLGICFRRERSGGGWAEYVLGEAPRDAKPFTGSAR